MIDKIFNVFCLILFLTFVIMNLVVAITTPDYLKLACIGYFTVMGIISGVARFIDYKRISTKVGLSEGLWCFEGGVILGLVISCFI